MWKKLVGEIAFEAASYGLKKHKAKKKRKPAAKKTAKKTTKRGK